MNSSKYLSTLHIGKSVGLFDVTPPMLANSEILFVLPYTRMNHYYTLHIALNKNFGTLDNIAECNTSVLISIYNYYRPSWSGITLEQGGSCGVPRQSLDTHGLRSHMYLSQ